LCDLASVVPCIVCYSCYASCAAVRSLPTRRSSDLERGIERRHLCRAVQWTRDHAPIGAAQFPSRKCVERVPQVCRVVGAAHEGQDRKSTRLNSSHVKSSYAVVCLKKNRTTAQAWAD